MYIIIHCVQGKILNSPCILPDVNLTDIIITSVILQIRKVGHRGLVSCPE